MIDLDAYQLEIVLGILDELAPRCEARAYGSRATWTAKDYSDLDLALLGPEPLPPATLWALQEAFEGSDLNIRVEVADWRAFSDGFRDAIAGDCVVIREPAGVKSGWQTTTVSDFVPFNYGKGTCTVLLGDCAVINDATYSLKEAWPFINYLDTGNITENRISEIRHLVSGHDAIPSRARRKACANDIVYSMVRPNQRHYGLLKVVPENFLASTGFSVIRGKDGLAITEFLYWFLAQDHVVERLHTIAEQSVSTYPSIKTRDLEQLEVPLPPIAEQRRIAQILGVLDDRIELNRRMNATLDAMCRALFRAWFVDFEPVRAKMSGVWRRGETLPGLPADLWDRFPSELVDTELGPAPAGWSVGTIGKCFNLTMGQSPPSRTYTDTGEGIPFFQGCADFGFRYPSKHRYCTAPTRIAEMDDTLVSVRAPVGTLNMAYEHCCIGRGLAALRHKSGSASYTYHAIESLQREIRQYEQNGTVFGAINKRQFEALATLEPPAEVIAVFDGIVAPLTERIFANSHGACALAALRDTLLPQLVSGELPLPASQAEGYLDR